MYDFEAAIYWEEKCKKLRKAFSVQLVVGTMAASIGGYAAGSHFGYKKEVKHSSVDLANNHKENKKNIVQGSNQIDSVGLKDTYKLTLKP